MQGRAAARKGHELASALPRFRALSVVSWGRNVEGQCGVEGAVMFPEAKEVASISGPAAVQSVTAGFQHSAAVTETGEVWTWGCGTSGKLGHGNSDLLTTPARVESLVGRVAIKSVALGHTHTLLRDTGGRVWACGANTDGQCGLGTPLAVLNAQKRVEKTLAAASGRVAAFHEAISEAEASMAGGGAGDHHWQQEMSSWQWNGGPRVEFVDHVPLQAELYNAHRYFGDVLTSRMSQQSYAGLGIMTSPESGLRWGQGEIYAPTRIDRDIDHTLNPLTHTFPSKPANPGTLIGSQVVDDFSAGRLFSALTTDSGRVYTFGGGVNGELGRSSAFQTSAREVDARVLQVLNDNGGAVSVRAGGKFCMALTATGKVVVWGQSPFPSPGGPPVVLDLPPITHIAAGTSHAIMTDGGRVWAIGRWPAASGKGYLGTGGKEPQELMRMAGESVVGISAGPNGSSAAVTDHGRLWMWGKLMSKDEARVLGAIGNGKGKPAAPAAVDWAGLGSDEPTLVPGLGNVESVSLGAAHVLATVG